MSKRKISSTMTKKVNLPTRKTWEGANAYEHSLDNHLEFFSKAGSLFENRKSFYGAQSESTALSLFQQMWASGKPELAMKLLFWLRDCRGGAGNRSGFRSIIQWLASSNDSKWLDANLILVPKYGRWDDLRSLFGTELQTQAAELWGSSVLANDVLATKWADRRDLPIFFYIRSKINISDIGEFRRLLSSVRKQHIVEHKMCSSQWNEIQYPHVPSVAMARYTKAFGRHDEQRFTQYKEDLKSGKQEIKAEVLFPHDCVRTARFGDEAIADAQFDALPNYLGESNERIIVIADTSGSMNVVLSGSIHNMDISQGLALYCSSRIPKDSPFHKKFIGFESESQFKDWEGMTFSEAIGDREIFDGACGSTRIDTALDLILKTAKFFKIPQELMPTTLLIVSDMQFHQGGSLSNDTEVEACLKKFQASGYKPPKVVYWNLEGYQGQQATKDMKNVGMVSGFSPSILKAIFGGTAFDPISIMLRAVEKYEIQTPYVN